MSRNRNTSTTRQKRKVRNTQKKVHHQHKDRLFRYIFQDKEDLLDLYNAVNDTDYDDPSELEITTLDDVIYLSMKNDLSFMLRITLNLYEHQSTWNENMPLRGFFYFAELYDKYIKEQGIKISETIRQVRLPFPKYVVFYNGTKDMPDRVELRLSDCFEKPEREEGEPCLECKALILNINAGRNRELMRKCHRLAEYAYFIGEIRRYMSDGWSLEEATDFSIQKCLRKEVLSDILEKSAMEVRRMILTEYDEIAAREYLKKESMEAGREEGREIGREEGREIGREEGREIGREEGREEGQDATFVRNLKNMMKNLGITAEEAMKILEVPKEQREKYLHILEEQE